MTKIEWAEEVWNPVTGCGNDMISPGCLHCYARRMANSRLKGRYGYSVDDPFKAGTFHPDKLAKPLQWKKAQRIFAISMGDLFHEDVTKELIAAVLGIVAFCQNHTFMILTKRPERALEFFSRYHDGNYRRNVLWWKNEACLLLPKVTTYGIRLRPPPRDIPLPNLWFGVTVESQREDHRILVLKEIPAAVKFISFEPLLGPFVFLAPWLRYIDWVIAAPETGASRRPYNIDWFRNLRDQCAPLQIPFFLKHLFENGKKQSLPTLDGIQWNQYPQRPKEE